MSESRLIRIYDRLLSETKSFFPAFSCRLLEGDPKDFPHKRNCAMCMYLDSEDGRVIDIFVAPKVLSMGKGRQEGLLRHEFGHAVEFHAGVAGVRKKVGERLPRGVERRADVIAERMFGAHIYYDRDLIQTTVGGTRPRPEHLGL
jgi:hypothetical protein